MIQAPDYIPYKTRREAYGTYPKQSSFRFDPLFLLALKRYQAHCEGVYGFKPSREDIMQTNTLQHNDWLSEDYDRLKKENKNNEKKYLDGIKTPKHPVFKEDFDIV